MKKEEFFVHLKKKLSVIEEQELNDILNEYEQHIAMKMRDGGIGEEEAIEDFGDIDELAAQILEAYHVKADYNNILKEERQDRLKENAKKFGKQTKNFLENIWDKIKTFFRKCKKEASSFLKKISRKLKKKDVETKDTKNTALPTDRKIEFAGKEKVRSTSGRVQRGVLKFGAWCKSIFNLLIKAVGWCIRISWNLFLLFLMACAGIFMCFTIFVFGTSIVLLFMGYPLTGVTLICFGLILCSFAAMFGLYLLIYRKKGSIHAISINGRRASAMVVLASFAVGVLFGGIGTGVGFGEFSQFTYGGKVELSDGKESVKRVYCEVPMEGTDRVIVGNILGEYEWLVKEIEEDPSIPMGQVCYEVTGSSEKMKWIANSYLSSEETEPEDSEKHKIYSVNIFFKSGYDDLEIFMLLKDRILKDIKERKLYSYEYMKALSARVLVNPEMKDYVKLSEGW